HVESQSSLGEALEPDSQALQTQMESVKRNIPKSPKPPPPPPLPPAEPPPTAIVKYKKEGFFSKLWKKIKDAAKVADVVGKAVTIPGLAMAAAEFAADPSIETGTAILGSAGGAWAGAEFGAALGAPLGPVGIIGGVIIFGIIGGIVGGDVGRDFGRALRELGRGIKFALKTAE